MLHTHAFPLPLKELRTAPPVGTSVIIAVDVAIIL